MRRLTTILLSVIVMTCMMSAVSFAADKDIVKTEKGYSAEQWYEDSEGNWNPYTMEGDLYTISIPKGTEEVTLDFGAERLAYNYDSNGTYIAGGVPDPTVGQYAYTVKTDAEPVNTEGVVIGEADGIIDYIQVQTPYVQDAEGNWSGGEFLYAITFRYVDTSLAKSSYVFTGKAIRPAVKGLDARVKYSGNRNVGKATAKATFSGANENFTYTVDRDYSFKITKAKNTATVTKKNRTFKAKNVKKAKKVFKAITVKNAKGTVTYARTGGSKKLTVNKKTGKITLKKGTKKGTYRIKVKVKAAGTGNYKSWNKTVTVKVTVK